MVQIYSNWDSKGRYRIRLTVTETSTNQAANQSSGTYELRLFGSSSFTFYDWNTSGNVVIDGGVHASWSGQNPGNAWTASSGVVLASGNWGPANHNADGSRSMSISATYTTPTSPTDYMPGSTPLTVSGTIVLTDFPRVPPAPIPVTPGNPDQITATSMRYRFNSNGDGGAAISRWEYQYSTSPSFASGNSAVITSSGTSTASGLDNHTTYYFRARGVNSVGAGPWTTTIVSGTTTGHPTAPLSPSATASTSVIGRVNVSWLPPITTGAGGIVGYNIFRDGVQIGTTTGTGTSFVDDGRTPFTLYSYTVAARNAYSTSVSGMGPQSAASAVVAQGAPSAPLSLVAIADGTIPGKVTLNWTQPTQTGAGGITGYKIYFAGGSLIADQSGTNTTYDVTGLNPGTTYSFQVFARNALSDAAGTMSVGSNTPTVTPIGEPSAPTGLTVTTSPTISNRLILTWTPPAGTLSGTNIFERIGGTDTLIQSVNSTHTTYTIDNVPAGATRTYVVRARTGYTDTLPNGYPGNWGGPASAPASGTSSNNSTQTVGNIAAATSGTNAIFMGTYIVSATTSNTVSYQRGNANIPTAASGGTIANLTNAIFNGTFPITSSPAPNKFTYAKTASNVGLLSVFGGTTLNNTNVTFNGTGFTASNVNAGAHTFQYTKAGSAVSTVAVPTNTEGNRGIVVNVTNTSFNVTGKIITAATEYTLSYTQSAANVPLSSAAGTVTNTTNRDTYNGVYTVNNVPSHNTFTYTTPVNTESSEVRSWVTPNGRVYRDTSTAVLDVRYRSGWIG